jgi:hypothetical protein
MARVERARTRAEPAAVVDPVPSIQRGSIIVGVRTIVQLRG